MSRVRRLAIVLMTVSVVVGAVYATGAFTNLTAQRDANIKVAGDASGYLALQPAPGPNGAYTSLRNGKLRVSLTGAIDGAGKGVNRDALTVVRNIFTITNKGSQPVGVWLTDKSKAVTFKGGTKWKRLEGRGHAVTLRPGQTLFVGLTVDTRRHTSGDLINAMTIHAESDVSGRAIESGPTGRGSATGSVTPPPDPDGDGLSSARERTGVDSSPKPGKQLVSTNPTLADTDGDGLSDSEEIGQSDPTERDTDGDLLSDGTERRWNADPTSADTDGDGIPDLRDPHPTQDDTPPIIAAQSRHWGDYFVLDVRGNGEIATIDVRAHFKPLSPLDGPQWDSHVETVEKLGDGKYRVNIKDWGSLSENPTKYQITITDKKGHTIRYQVDLTGDKPTIRALAVPGLAATAASPVPGDAVVFGLLVGGAVIADVGYEYIVNSPEPVTQKQLSTAVQISDTAATYTPGETDPRIEMPVRLPSGRTYDAPQGNERRFGKEQIVQLPGITQGNAEATIGEILKAPSAIHHQGKYTIIIGDNPHGPGKLKFWLLNGMVLTAERVTDGETISDERETQQETEETQTEDNERTQTPTKNRIPRRPPPPPDPRVLPDGGSKDHPEGYEALKKQGVSEEDLRYYAKNGIAPNRISTALDHGVSSSALRKYIEDGYSLHRMNYLLDQGVTPDDLKTYTTTDIEGHRLRMLRVLLEHGVMPDELRQYVDNGENLRSINHLIYKGVTPNTLSEWSNKGYDLSQMSNALKRYQASGKTLHSVGHEAKGELGEIIAKPEVMNDYLPSKGYENYMNVELDKSASGEIDWVVVDTSTGNVVATYQVKSHPDKAYQAEEQAMDIKNAFKEGEVDRVTSHENLSVRDFKKNIDEIDRYTMGPENSQGYDKTFDLTRDELEALLDTIREKNL
jgi:DNA-binding transcriptional MerR regulator